MTVTAVALAFFSALVSADTIFRDGFEVCLVADAVEWDGGGDGVSWSDQLNWADDTLPVDGDAVAILEADSLTVEYAGLTTALSCLRSTANLTVHSGELMLDGPSKVEASLAILGGGVTANTWLAIYRDLDLNLGQLTGTGIVNVNGLFTWTAGSLNGLGETIANNGAVISGANNKTLNERTLSLNDASSWTGSGALQLRSGATINVNATFDIATDADMQHTFGTNPIMNINGSLIKSAGTSLTSIGAMFNNDGSVVVDSGQLYLGTFDSPFIGNSNGDFSVTEGSTLTVRGNHTYTASSSFIGAGGYIHDGGTAVMQGTYALTGTLGVSGGTVQFPSSATIPGDVLINGGDLELQSGASIAGDVTINSGDLLVSGPVSISGALQQEPLGGLDGPETVTVNGLFTWNGGSQRGVGETIANGGAQITGANTKGLSERTLSLNGASSWTGSGALRLRWGPTININEPFDIATDANLEALQGAYGILNINNSLIKSAGAGETQVGMLTENSGSIAVTSGQLSFQQSYDQNTFGELDVTITSNAEFDFFPVGTVATLDGTLNINLVDGYEPELDETFEIMTATSVNDLFATVNGTAIVTGRKFEVVYGANNVTLKVVPE